MSSGIKYNLPRHFVPFITSLKMPLKCSCIFPLSCHSNCDEWMKCWVKLLLTLTIFSNKLAYNDASLQNSVTLFLSHQVSRPEIDLQLKATDRSHIRARPNRRTGWQQVLRMTAGACSNLVNRFIAAFWDVTMRSVGDTNAATSPECFDRVAWRRQ